MRAAVPAPQVVDGVGELDVDVDRASPSAFSRKFGTSRESGQPCRRVSSCRCSSRRRTRLALRSCRTSRRRRGRGDVSSPSAPACRAGGRREHPGEIGQQRLLTCGAPAGTFAGTPRHSGMSLRSARTAAAGAFEQRRRGGVPRPLAVRASRGTGRGRRSGPTSASMSAAVLVTAATGAEAIAQRSRKQPLRMNGLRGQMPTSEGTLNSPPVPTSTVRLLVRLGPLW